MYFVGMFFVDVYFVHLFCIAIDYWLYIAIYTKSNYIFIIQNGSDTF